MKKFGKTINARRNKLGETMVEVIVAFTVLSIMLLVFAEGLQMATRNEVNADKSRKGADSAMATVQSKIAAGENFGTAGEEITITSEAENVVGIVPYTYTDPNGYSFVVYRADP